MRIFHKLFAANENYIEETKQFQKVDLLFSLAAYGFLWLTYYTMGKYFHMLGSRLTKPVFYSVELLQVLTAFLLIFVFCKIRKQSFWQAASLGDIKRSFAGGVAVSVICFLVMAFLSGWHFAYGFRAAGIRFFYYLIYISLHEEFVFRGYIGKRFYGVIPDKFIAVFCVALLFALIHIPFQMAYSGMGLFTYLSMAWGNLLFCFGIHFVFQMMYARFNSIAMPCIVHCFWDFVQDLF